MALTHDGRAVAAVYGAETGRTRTGSVWTGVYAVLALLVTAAGVAGAAYLATTLTTGPGATGPLLVASIAAFAVGPVLARSAVRLAYRRLAARATAGTDRSDETDLAGTGPATATDSARDTDRCACA